MLYSLKLSKKRMKVAISHPYLCQLNIAVTRIAEAFTVTAFAGL
jgi:hypothetical protein